MTHRPECPLVDERLPAWLDGALPDGEAALVGAHLEGCARCAASRGRLRATLDALAADRPAGADVAAARRRLSTALDADARRRARSRRLHRLAIAAALVLSLGVAWFLEPPAVRAADFRKLGESLAHHLHLPSAPAGESR